MRIGDLTASAIQNKSFAICSVREESDGALELVLTRTIITKYWTRTIITKYQIRARDDQFEEYFVINSERPIHSSATRDPGLKTRSAAIKMPTILMFTVLQFPDMQWACRLVYYTHSGWHTENPDEAT